MPEKFDETIAAHQVEQAARQLDCLSILPAVASQFFPKLLQPQVPVLADIVESDPALAVKVLWLAHQNGIDPAAADFSFRKILAGLPVRAVRDAVLSVKISDEPKVDSEPVAEQLLIHSIATAFCARRLAETMYPQVEPELAYLAGLLHDIGKLALLQMMPKSFANITELAKMQRLNSCTVEQKYLGIDHAVLGKRLAQKWHLPGQITTAIWLHHSDTEAIASDAPPANIAHIIHLADYTVRQWDIGRSGSYDLTEQTVPSLALGHEQIQRFRRDINEQVTQKTNLLGLDSSAARKDPFKTVHAAASQLAHENSKLSAENQRLQTLTVHLDFITEFLMSIDLNSPPIEIAENLAKRWQRFYQTGAVCLYLTPPDSALRSIEAAVVKNMFQSRTVLLNGPKNFPLIPPPIANGFGVTDAEGHLDWLFSQLDIEFDAENTKAVPLLCSGAAVAVVVFELRHPKSIDRLEENFKTVGLAAGMVLGVILTSENRQNLAERFARLLGGHKSARQSAYQQSDLMAAIAEMAAGAAHELNNPLAVVMGRAQMLADTETDQEKKRILKQIQENTGEISQIINDMMLFARPQPPDPSQVNIKHLFDEAVNLAAQKLKAAGLDVHIQIADASAAAFVDQVQITAAVSNIFCNAIESYPGKNGPVKATACIYGSVAKLAITDSGRGMDQETLEKATQPFFSAKAAGRNRGMGLSYAQRVIQLNGGTLSITSQPGSGTTVTILLPAAAKPGLPTAE